MIIFSEPLYIPHIGAYVPGSQAELEDDLEQQLVMSGRARWFGDAPSGAARVMDVLSTNHDENITGIRAVLRDLAYGPGNDLWGLADYYPTYEQLGIETDPSSIFEIGTHHGNSLISLVSGAVHCTRIGWLEINPTASDACRENLSHFLQTRGRDATLWSDNDRDTVHRFGRAELVHIDGDHSFDGATKDFELCAAVLQPTWLLVDDYDYPGVRQAVDKFSETYGAPEIMRRATRDHVNELAIWRTISWGAEALEGGG